MEIKKAEGKKCNTTFWEQGGQTHLRVSRIEILLKTCAWTLRRSAPSRAIEPRNHWRRNAWEETTHYARERCNTTHDNEQLEQWKQMKEKWEKGNTNATERQTWKRKQESAEWRIFPAATCCGAPFCFWSCILESVSINKTGENKNEPVVFFE